MAARLKAQLSQLLQYSPTNHEAFSGFWIGAYDAATVLQPVGGTRVVYSTDSGNGPVTVSNL